MSALVLDQARSINRRVYRDSAIFADELVKIFQRCWIFVAHESEIPSPGDYVTRRIGPDPVIVNRDEEGEIRVLLNACRHRGVQLCSADLGNTSHFRCSYHGWTYNNSGALRGVPQAKDVYGTIDRDHFGLRRARVEARYGLIFACWDQEGPSLSEYLGDADYYLKALLGRLDDGYECVGVPSRGYLHANWKLGAENYGGDGYHIATTHKGSVDLGVYGRLGDDFQFGSEEGYAIHAGNGHLIRVQRLPFKSEQRFYYGSPPELSAQFAKHLSEAQLDLVAGNAAWHGNIFPNLSFIEVATPPSDAPDAVPRAMVHLRLWNPVAPDRTELLFWVLAPAATDEAYKRDCQRAFVRRLGLGGIFETDDLHNWTSIAETTDGPLGRAAASDFSAGDFLEPLSDQAWPGEIYHSTHTDMSNRYLWRRWQELMENPS